MKLLKILIVGLVLLITACVEKQTNEVLEDKPILNEESQNEELTKIPILNFGTFHMGFTTDENTTEFDEKNKKNQEAVHQIAEKLASFQPTVIIVETVPKNNDKLQLEYREYLEKPEMSFEKPSEIELLAYELGRLCGTKRIYGIDHRMGYNYNIGFEIENKIDSTWHNKYYQDPLSFYPQVNINQDSFDLLNKLKLTNNERYLDFLIAVNSDMLTHVGSEDGFEGADEAAKYYQRNLRMYSNLNRIDLEKDDRVFILMGASHTAFFRDFISRSPKYKMVNTFDFLK